MEKKFTEFTGKTVEEAVSAGLEELGLTEEEAEIKVLEEGKKRLFGSIKARVEIAPKMDEPEETSINTTEEEKALTDEENKSEINMDEGGRTDGERAIEFLNGLFDILNIEAETELVKEEEKIEINVKSDNTNSIIGKRGVMLDAIQALVGAVANKGREHYKRVVVDCENYRENREETLVRLSEKIKEKALFSRKKIKLEPMNAYERRIIHAALSKSDEVTTQSEGSEPHRYIVVIPNNLEDEDAPAIAFRRETRYGGQRYRKPYNKGYGNRRSYNKGGYRKPYNRDRQNNDNGEGREYNRNRSNGNSRKSTSDFFGTFIGNSKNN